MTQSSYNLAELEQLQADRATEAEWLQAFQQNALEHFGTSGFPTTRLENWKYTDLRAMAKRYPDWLRNTPPGASPSLPLLDIEGALQVVFVDGQFRPDLSSSELPDVVCAGSLQQLSERFPDTIERRLGSLAASDASGMVAMNAAFATDAVAVVVPDGVELDQSIYLSFQSLSGETSVQPRVLIELGANARATVFEHYVSNTAAIVNGVTEIFCGPGADLQWDKLQEESTDTWHTAVQVAELDRDARLRVMQVDTGAQLARNELTVRLAGRGAHLEARGLFMADAKRHADSRINVEHAAPDTTSLERYRGILADTARGVFNGRILVEQEAQKTAADLTNRNLLLNKGAEIDTKPELEIYADDVKCAHGSTTGQLDAKAMFYLLSRGIDPALARNLLIRAFAAELVTDIGVPALSDKVIAAIDSLGQDHA